MVDYPEYKPDGAFERYFKKLNKFGQGNIISLFVLIFGFILTVYGLWKDNGGYVGYDEHIFLGMMMMLGALTTTAVMKLH